MEYYNLDINIEPRLDDRLVIKARSQTQGEADGFLALDAATAELVALCQQLAGGNSTNLGREIGVSDETSVAASPSESVAEVGEKLWKAVFSDGLRDLYSQCLGEVQRDDQKGVRLRLCVEDAELATLPWEVLYDRARDTFLATSIETPLTRYVSVHEPIRQLEATPPISILIVIPAASGLNVQAERNSIAAALSKLGNVVDPLILDGIVTRSDISRALSSKPFHIFHFIGHGTFRGGEGHLVINAEDRAAGEDVITGHSFGGFFKDYPSMKLAVLNACQGAEVSATQPLAGVAPQLVRRGVPAVVAMQYPIEDRAAVLFAAEFYGRLCVGTDRGRVDTAVSHARNRLEMDYPGTLAFATPVLFMRSPSGVIFDIESSGAKAPFVRPRDDIDRLVAIRSTYEADTKLLAESGDPASLAAVVENERRVGTIRRQLRNHQFVVAGLVAVPLFLASWLSLFNAPFLLRLDDRAEMLFVRAMDSLVPAAFSSDIALVLADEDGRTNGALGATSPAWRCHHADLIDGLAAARALVVAFDLFFDHGFPECDAKLALAIERARQAGTRVVVGVENIDWVDGAPRPRLTESLRAAVGDGWGTLGADPAARKVPLARLPDQTPPGWIEAEEVGVAPSFSLRTVMESYPKQRGPIAASFDRRRYQIALRDRDHALVKSIPVVDRFLNVIVGVPELSQMAADNSYSELLAIAGTPGTLAAFKDRIVLVGYRAQRDLWDVGQERPLYGVHLHAATISNLLLGDYVRPLALRWHYAIIVCMAAFGVLLRTRPTRLTYRRLRFTLPGRGTTIEVPVALVGILLLYVAIAIFLYWLDRIVVDFSYHVFALVFTYWLLGRLRSGIGVGRTNP